MSETSDITTKRDAAGVTPQDRGQQAFAFAPPPVESKRSNLVIEAGAGTGKTTAIVGEVLRLMLEHEDLEPERIVLMTFTEKAAGEIAERIRTALEELSLQIREGSAEGGAPLVWPRGSADPRVVIEDREHAFRTIERHLSGIDSLRSQTIHSFCQSILRTFPIEAGLDPQFRIIEGFERALLYNELYDEWLDRETRAGASLEIVREWEILFEHTGYFFFIRELVFSLAGRRDLLGEDSLDFGGFEDVDRILREAVQWILVHPPQAKDPATERIAQYVHATPLRGENVDQWIDWLHPIAGNIRKVNLTSSGALKPAVRALRGEPGESAYDALLSHRAGMAVVSLTRRFLAFLDDQKRTRGVVDFDDLLLRTLEVLDDPAVLARARSQVDFIFVDEFQDTDRTQARIIEKLARDASGAWVAGKTIVVGDPKQSIYGFRRADPQTYDEMTSALTRAGAESRPITTQYRSDPALLASINSLCASLFSAKAPNQNVFTPGYLPLIPGRAGTGDAEPRITMLHALHEEKADRYLAEAETIAAWIRANRDGGAEDLKRFAILFRRMTNLDDYLGVLERHGIDYVLPPTRNFLDRRAPVDLMAVLRAIAWPFDKGAVISAARTPYFALTDIEIVKDFPVPVPVPVPGLSAFESPENPGTGTGAGTGTGIETVLASYREASRHLTVSQLIDLVIETSGIEAVYAASADGERELSHLERVRAIAFDYDQRTGGSVRQFVDEISDRRDEPEEMEPVLVDESKNAVRILTVHAAKGLEFETVILPDLSFGGGSSEALQFFTTGDPPSLVLSGRAESISANFRETEDGEKLKKVASQRDDAEMRRLFYVAVTRAKREVVFVCNLHPETTSRGFLKCIHEALMIDRKLFGALWPESGRKIEETPIGSIAFEKILEGSALPPLSSRHTRLRDRALEEELLNEPLAPCTIATPAPVTERLPTAEVAARRAGSRSRDAGLLLHRLLELWDGESIPEPLLRQLAIEAGADAETVDRVRKRLAVVQSSPMLRRIASSETLGREVPVRFLENGMVVERRIDRLIREHGSEVVIDYKSGKPEPARVAKDREQVDRYCQAIAEITGRPCAGVLWYIDLETDEPSHLPAS